VHQVGFYYTDNLFLSYTLVKSIVRNLSLNKKALIKIQDRLFNYIVTLRYVLVTIVAVEKQ